MIQLVRHQALLVLVALLIFFTNLGNYALFNQDEPKNAVCGAEMLRRSDWIVPSFNEELRTDKPILVYWFMLTSFHLFGVSEFSARLASSLMAVGTTLLTYHLGRKLYSAYVGFLAGLILCTCLLFSAVGRSVTPDSTLIFFVTLTFASYVWVVARQRGGNFDGGENPEDGIRLSATDSEGSQSDRALWVSSKGIPLKGNAVKNSLVDNGGIDRGVPLALPVSDMHADCIPEAMEFQSTPSGTGKASGTREKTQTERSPFGPLVPYTWKLAAPAFLAMGMAVLAKGPVGVVLPCTIVLLFLLISLRERDLESDTLKSPEGPWWRRGFVTVAQIFRPRQIFESIRGMKLLVGLGIVAAIALPWYLAVSVMTNGDWLRGFLFDHNVGRVLSAKESHDGFPLYQFYYLVIIPLGCFPWSVFLPVAVYQMQQRFVDGAAWRDSDRLLACWAGVWFVFFSLAGTKLPNYVLPMYPALALILARYFYDWERDEIDSGVYSFNLCCRAMFFAGAVMIVGVIVAAYLLFASEQWLGMIGAIPMIGAFAAVKFLDREQRRRVIQCLMGTAFLLAFLIVGIAPARISRYQDSPLFIAEARRRAAGAEIEIGTYGYFQPSVVFYARKKVTVLQTPNQVADFIATYPHAFVITPMVKHNELRDVLMGDVSELMRHRDFLRREELILLGRH